MRRLDAHGTPIVRVRDYPGMLLGLAPARTQRLWGYLPICSPTPCRRMGTLSSLAKGCLPFAYWHGLASRSVCGPRSPSYRITSSGIWTPTIHHLVHRLRGPVVDRGRTTVLTMRYFLPVGRTLIRRGQSQKDESCGGRAKALPPAAQIARAMTSMWKEPHSLEGSAHKVSIMFTIILPKHSCFIQTGKHRTLISKKCQSNWTRYILFCPFMIDKTV